MRDPLATLLAVQRAFDSAVRSDGFVTHAAGSGAFPRINVFRESDGFTLAVELPGVKKEDLDVQVKGNEVRIRGTKTVRYDENARVHRRERTSSSFDRTVQLPAHVEAEKVSAEYRDGVLTVRLPLAERDKPRAVTIN